MLTNMKRMAIVTGAARGIGRAIVNRLVDEGYTVIAVDVDEAGLDQLKAETGRTGVITRIADVGNSSFARKLMQELDPNELELLVNNAGIRWTRSVLEETDDEWETSLRTNLSGPFYLIREVGRAMAGTGRGGLIINMASVSGLVGLTNRASYCATKGGLVMLTKAAAMDLAPAGVRVIAICPGVIDTSMTKTLDNTESFVSQYVPLGKSGLPKDIAQVVIDLTRWPMATGSTVVVDGGLTAGIRL